MITMKTKLSLLVLAFTLCGLSACHDDDPALEPEQQEEDFAEVFSPAEPDYAFVAIDAPVFISSSIKAEVKDALQSFLTNITSLEEAEVAVVRDEDIGTYNGELLDLYQRGGFIIVAQPDGDRYREFAANYNLPNAIPFGASQDVLLYATSNQREHYVLYSTNPFNTDEIEDPVILSMLEKNAESYYKRRIFELCRWLKEQRQSQADTRSDITYVSQFDPKVLITKCDLINHDFSIPMNHVVADFTGGSPDVVDVTGSVVVKYTIYSAYVFEGAKQPGDYYIVKADLLVRNGSMYDTFSKRHGLVLHSGAGYFMKKFELVSSLIDPSDYLPVAGDDSETVMRKKEGLKQLIMQMAIDQRINQGLVVPGVYFFSTPSPTTTIGATSYTSGINVGISGSLSAGPKSIGGNLGFSANYESSESKTISDLSIKVDTEANSQEVKNTYMVENFGTFWKADGAKEIEKCIPLIARSDFNAASTWCWVVPAGSAGVEDSSDVSFHLLTYFDYHYEYFVDSSSQFNMDGFHKKFNNASYAASEVPHASREPFGVIALKNNETMAIYDISVWVQDEHVGEGDPLVIVDSGYEPGEEALCALPVGTYYIEFTMKYKQPDDPTHMVTSRWKLGNIKVKSDSDQDKATTKISSANFELIDVN